MHDLQDILGVDRERMEVNFTFCGDLKVDDDYYVASFLKLMMIQVSVEPGITIGFLNRLLVAEGLSLAVVPEVFIRW